jgi:hypothetical protein
MVHDEIMAQFVEGTGGNARLNVQGDHIQRFRREAPRGAHPSEIVRRVDSDAP